MKVKFLDLSKNIEPVKREIAEATHQVINNCNFIMGANSNNLKIIYKI